MQIKVLDKFPLYYVSHRISSISICKQCRQSTSRHHDMGRKRQSQKARGTGEVEVEVEEAGDCSEPL